MPGESSGKLPGTLDRLEGEADPDPLEFLEGAAFHRKAQRPLGEAGEHLARQHAKALRLAVDEDERCEAGEEGPVVLLLGNFREGPGGRLP